MSYVYSFMFKTGSVYKLRKHLYKLVRKYRCEKGLHCPLCKSSNIKKMVNTTITSIFKDIIVKIVRSLFLTQLTQYFIIGRGIYRNSNIYDIPDNNIWAIY